MKKGSSRSPARAVLILVGTGLLLGTNGGATAAVEKSVMNDGTVLLNTRCAACHSVDRPKQARKSPDQWEQTVSRMIRKGAQLSESEKRVLIDHLAKIYGQ